MLITIRSQKMGVTNSFLSYKHLKLKLGVFLIGDPVAMVAFFCHDLITMCSPMIGQFFDTMIVASTNKYLK